MAGHVSEDWPERAEVIYEQLQMQVMWRWLGIIIGGIVLLLRGVGPESRASLRFLLLAVAVVNGGLSYLIRKRRLPLSHRNLGVGADILFISIAIYLSEGWESSLYVLYALAIVQQPLVMSLREIVTVTFAASLSYLAALSLRGDLGLIWVQPEVIVNIAFRNCFLFLIAFIVDRSLRRSLSERIKSEAIIESTAEGLIVVDIDRRIQRVNAAAERILRKTRADLAGMFCGGALHGQLCDEGCPLSLAMSRRGSVIHVEEVLQPNPKRCFPVRTSVAALIDSRDQIVGASMAFQDISERMVHEEARQEFLAAVSHELRSPLASMASLAEVLAEGEMENMDVSREYGRILWKESRRLVEMVERLRRLSRLEREDLVITLENAELGDVCESALAALRKYAEECHVCVRLHAPSPSPLALIDRDLAQQILINLLENAIRYSRKGDQVDVTIREIDGMPEVLVEDHGPGIPRTEIPYVFDKFYRGEDARESYPQGTGLGLALVRRIGDLLGAKVSVSGQEGQGCVFSVCFRAATGIREWVMEG